MTAAKKKETEYVRGQREHYHNNARDRIYAGTVPCIGIEAEIHVKQGFDAANLPRLNIKGDPIQLDAEADGSLDRHRGVEIITRRPVPYTMLQEWMPRFCEHLTQNIGAEDGKQSGNAGLHINVNVQGWQQLKVCAFLAITNLSIERFAAVSERGILQEPIGHHNTNREQEWAFVGQPFNRHKNAGIRQNFSCVEVRGFHMNTDPKQFVKKVNFVLDCEKLAEKFPKTIMNFWAETQFCEGEVDRSVTSELKQERAELMKLLWNNIATDLPDATRLSGLAAKLVSAAAAARAQREREVAEMAEDADDGEDRHNGDF